jgi:hypothetical protein
MTIQLCKSSLIAAGIVVLSGLAGAQQPYPDLKGTWIGPGQSVTQGKTDHWPNAGETEPVFRESSWTLVVDRQEGNRFVGSQGLSNGTRRDPVLAVIREDRRTIHMVDDDGTFNTILSGPDTMEMCRTEVTAVSRIVGCRQLTRQK